MSCVFSNDESSASEPATSGSAARGRRSKFSKAQEVAAAKAHIAEYGDVKARFAEAACRANMDVKPSNEVSAKSIQDRYMKQQNSATKESGLLVDSPVSLQR